MTTGWRKSFFRDHQTSEDRTSFLPFFIDSGAETGRTYVAPMGSRPFMAVDRPLECNDDGGLAAATFEINRERGRGRCLGSSPAADPAIHGGRKRGAPFPAEPSEGTA